MARSSRGRSATDWQNASLWHPHDRSPTVVQTTRPPPGLRAHPPLLLVSTRRSHPSQPRTPRPSPGRARPSRSPRCQRASTRRWSTKSTEVIDTVRPVRGLPAADDVAYRVIDDETFLEELKSLFREEYPEAYLAAEDDAFTRLGLLDATAKTSRAHPQGLRQPGARLLRPPDQDVLAHRSVEEDRLPRIDRRRPRVRPRAPGCRVGPRGPSHQGARSLRRHPGPAGTHRGRCHRGDVRLGRA